MVAMFEIVFLIVCVLLGLWWFSRTEHLPVSPEVGSRTGSV